MATQGSEILGYKGQAENAGGFTGDGRQIGGELTQFNNMLSDLTRQNTIWNMREYEQKVKDRDDVMKAVSENQIDFPVDDVYRPQLEGKLEEIRKIRLKTPDIKSNPQAYKDLQKAISEFREMNTYAKANSVELKKMLQDYANNPDERYRKMLGSHIEGERGKGILHQVQPYQKMQDWSSSLFGDVPEKIVTKTTMTGQGGATGGDGKEVVQETVTNEPNKSVFAIKQINTKPVDEKGIAYNEVTVGSDIRDWDAYYSPANFLEGENKNLPDQARKFYEFFTQSPEFTNDGTLNAINSKLDAINKANPNARQRRPIAVKEGESWRITATPIELAEAVSLYKNFEMPKTSRVVDEKKMGAKKNLSEIAENYASGRRSDAAAAKDYWEIQKEKQMLPKELEKIDSEIEKNKREKSTDAAVNLQGLGAVRAVTQLVEDVNKKSFYSLGRGTVAGPNSKYSIPSSDVRDAAGVSDSAEITVVPLSSLAVRQGMAMPNIKDGRVAAIQRPQKAFMIRDGEKIRFVGIYPPGDKEKKNDGKSYKLVSFSPESMASTYISAENNFVTTDKDQAAKDLVTARMTGVFPGDGAVNTSSSETTTTSQTQVVKEVKGKRYANDGQGWYEL